MHDSSLKTPLATTIIMTCAASHICIRTIEVYNQPVLCTCIYIGCYLLFNATCILLYFSSPALLGNTRFRRDARTLEEEEEMWFDQDEYDELDHSLPEALKPKPNDVGIDQILERFFPERKPRFDSGEAKALR